MDEAASNVVCCHTNVHVGADLRTAMEMITQFLDEHPCETIFVMLKPECETVSVELVEAAFEVLAATARVYKSDTAQFPFDEDTNL